MNINKRYALLLFIVSMYGSESEGVITKAPSVLPEFNVVQAQAAFAATQQKTFRGTLSAKMNQWRGLGETPAKGMGHGTRRQEESFCKEAAQECGYCCTNLKACLGNLVSDGLVCMCCPCIFCAAESVACYCRKMHGNQ